jgi:multidrug efflux pump subunit AcrB
MAFFTNIVPNGFLPEEDQGAFMGEVQLPDAARPSSRTLRRRRGGREGRP